MSRERTVPYLEKRFREDAVVFVAEVAPTAYGYKVFPREIWKCASGVTAPTVGHELNLPSPPETAKMQHNGMVLVGIRDAGDRSKFSLLALNAEGSPVMCPDLDRVSLRRLVANTK